MAFTEKELEFLEENRELLERGPQVVPEVVNKVIDSHSSSDFMKSKLIFAIVYSTYGVKGFSAVVTASYKASVIEGALLNRTSARANGQPILPQMLKAKTKIVFYRIENNKIHETVESSLTDLTKYKNTLNEGNYNLVILDTPSNRLSVENAFGGIISFTVRLAVELAKEYGYLKAVSLESKDVVEAKSKAKDLLAAELSSRIGMTSAVKEVVDYAVDQADFKV